MATSDKKFLYISGNTEGKKLADLLSEITNPTGAYYKTIVFAAETNEIYNRGKAYGLSVADAQRITDLESAVEALENAQVVVKEGEKVIGFDTDGVSLTSTLSLDYDSANKKLQIKGIGDAVVAELDATAFIKDGIVNSATLVQEDKEDEEGNVVLEAPYISITFNTDAEQDPIEFSVKSLVDIYNAANINLTSAYQAAETYTPANVKSGASMDAVVAELVAGIAEAKANAGVTSVGGKTGAITLEGALTENGTINLTIDENNKITATINGLGTAAYTNVEAYATAEQGETADSAIQSITIGSKTLTKESNEITAAEILADLDLSAYVQKADAVSATSTGGDYVEVTLGGTQETPTLVVAETTKSIKEATAEDDGLAVASDVRGVIEENERVTSEALNDLDERIKSLEDDSTDADAITALAERVSTLEDETDWEEF